MVIGYIDYKTMIGTYLLYMYICNEYLLSTTEFYISIKVYTNSLIHNTSYNASTNNLFIHNHNSNIYQVSTSRTDLTELIFLQVLPPSFFVNLSMRHAIVLHNRQQSPA